MSYWSRNPFTRNYLIAKFNPFHDEAGKFASAESSTVATRMLNSISDGGFTYDPAGKVPTKGFAVGVFPQQSITLPIADVTKEKVAHWMQSNTKLLQEKNTMLGGWTDAGNLYLDIVKVFPPNEKEQAIQAGQDHNQISIADLAAIHRGDWDTAIINTGGSGVQKSTGKPHLVLATPDTDVTEFLDRLKIYPKK